MYESDHNSSIELVAKNILDRLKIVSARLDISGILYLRVVVITAGRPGVGPRLW